MTNDRKQKAKRLLELHHGSQVLVLPNIWDCIGARVLAHKGYPAVATASAAVSSSLGYDDGEKISRDTMLSVVARIAAAVEIPLSADIETGYADSLDDLAETTRAVIDAGAVGINIEDSIVEGRSLRSPADQAERIATVRDTAAALNLHLVINARVDSFVSNQFADPAECMEDAVTRASAYARAGADCIYPMGPGDAETLTTLRARIRSPLNALATAQAAPLTTMASIGINRVSFGPFIFRSCLRKFADIADALSRSESYDCFGREMFSRSDVAEFLTSHSESDIK